MSGGLNSIVKEALKIQRNYLNSIQDERDKIWMCGLFALQSNRENDTSLYTLAEIIQNERKMQKDVIKVLKEKNLMTEKDWELEKKLINEE